MNMKKNMVIFVAIFAVIFVSCGSTSTAKEGTVPGYLTITGIPADFEGRYSTVLLNRKGRRTTIIYASAEKSRKSSGQFIINGELKMRMHEYVPGTFEWRNSRYTGSDICDISINIYDDSRSYRIAYAQFESVKFEQGTAMVEWSDGYISSVW